ncbi:MAG: hypothetical protein HOA16_08695 [Opitutae bacterium]|jgi:hypothetical protein|nr:hypothetical protein [Opitutae bacterium]
MQRLLILTFLVLFSSCGKEGDVFTFSNSFEKFQLFKVNERDFESSSSKSYVDSSLKCSSNLRFTISEDDGYIYFIYRVKFEVSDPDEVLKYNDEHKGKVWVVHVFLKDSLGNVIFHFDPKENAISSKDKYGELIYKGSIPIDSSLTRSKLKRGRTIGQGVSWDKKTKDEMYEEWLEGNSTE